MPIDQVGGTDPQPKSSKDSGEDPINEFGRAASVKDKAQSFAHIVVEKLITNTASLGISQDGDLSKTPAADTGSLSTPEIVSVTSSYFATIDFLAIQEMTRPGDIVILRGKPGSGRRAAGIALLSGLDNMSSLVVLSPVLSLESLASRAWSEKTGYLLLDHQAEYGAKTDEIQWRAMRSALDERGSALVITTTKALPKIDLPFVHVEDWTFPDPRGVVLSHLESSADDLDDGVVEDALSTLPPDPAPAQLRLLAERLKAGMSADEALAVFANSVRDRVDEWFSRRIPLAQLAEVTVAAFCGVQSERHFFRHVQGLHELLVGSLQRGDPIQKSPAEGLSTDRRQFLGDDLLIEESRLIHRSRERVIAFGDEDMRVAIIGKLWQSQNGQFWDAISAWIDQLVMEDLFDEVAYALAVLARSSALEVEVNYLERWAVGGLGVYSQLTTISALWYMSRNDETAPIALQIVTDWLESSIIGQRQCAVVALCGDLGVRFPGEAVRRLWQAVSQSSTVREDALASFGALFSRLVELERDASLILKFVARELEKRQTTAVKFRDVQFATFRLAYEVTAAKLSTGRSSCFKYLHDLPASSGPIAEIFVRLIRWRPAREYSMRSLRQGLLDLEAFGENPIDEARAFGVALFNALPNSEAESFVQDFLYIDKLVGRGVETSSATTILACLESFGKRTSTSEAI